MPGLCPKGEAIYDFDHLEAEKEFQRAIALNPRYATAHQWYGHCLGYVGRFDESLASTRRALQLDPLSPIIHASHAGSSWVARDWDQVIATCKQGLELDPNFAALHWLLAHAHQGKKEKKSTTKRSLTGNALPRFLETRPCSSVNLAEPTQLQAAEKRQYES